MTSLYDTAMNTPGRFIVLEGGEGAGKTTQLAAIRRWLVARGIEVVTTREPGGTPIGEDIRRVLMTDYDAPMPPVSELGLIYAARGAHLAELIQPALWRGTWVICDRFNDASYAYQGAGRGLGMATVDAFDRAVVADQQPDLVLFFDLPAQVGLDRVEARAEGNRFDRQRLAFHERVRQAYHDRIAAAPDRYRVVDATLDPDAVTGTVQSILAEWTHE